MKKSKKVVELVVLVAVAALLVLTVVNAQAIHDWISLYGYTPSSDISNLATQDTMTAKAKHLFYLNQPQLISDKTQFRSSCPTSEQTIVLGCYHSTEAGIAIYSVSDPRLNGVEQVTAAHEMLHGAYDRLSAKDKNYVDGLLQDYYNSGLTDQRVKDVINTYKQTEPKDLADEMHSVFGTEVGSLPPALESYYQRYFTNRQAVTNFSSQYENVFTQNQQQLQSLKSQIDQLKSQLDADKQTIQSTETSLSAQNQNMQSLLNSGQTRAYNSQVDSYNSEVRNLRALIASYNSMVDQVNNLVTQYNQLAVTQESLNNSLDTRLQTQTAE